MIKKHTQIIFRGTRDAHLRDERLKMFEEGVILSKGDVISLYEEDEVVQYEVVDKRIDCFFEGQDQIVNTTFVLSHRQE